MNKFNDFMEKHFVPVAAKIGSQKVLIAIRDAFIGIMPVTMAGAVATLLNVFLRDLPTTWGLDGFVTAMAPIIGVNGNVWWGSLAILTLVFIFALGYNISKVNDVNPLAGGVITFASYYAVLPQVANDAWGATSWAYTDARGLFTALFVGLVTAHIYVFLMKRKITIKLPDSVPPAVSNAFAAIIPGTVAIYVAGIASYLMNTFAGQSIPDFIATTIQQPMLLLSQNLISVILTVFFVQLFWFFGLHGTNLLAPALDGVYKTALAENTNAYNLAVQAGQKISEVEFPHIWTRASFDAFVWMGGAGVTLALIIAILIFSKKEEQRAVAKMSAPMGVFNINEPVVFGLPIVLNSIYIIPFIFVPIVLTITAYFATAIGLVTPAFVEVPWVMPPVIYAILATGGDIMAGVVALVNFVIAIVLWAPFVIVANKVNND